MAPDPSFWYILGVCAVGIIVVMLLPSGRRKR